MAELIYGPSLLKIQGSGLGDITQSTNSNYRSLALTTDGHLYNRGKSYSFLESLITDSLNANKIIKWDNTQKKFVLGDDKNEVYYSLTINGTKNGTQVGDTSLGNIYAPTKQTGITPDGIPSISGSTWSWNKVETDLSKTDATGIPTASAVKQYVTGGLSDITSALTGAFQYKGTVTVNPTSEDWVEPTGNNAYQVGNVVSLGTKEFVKTDSGWKELGDEGSFLLKDKKPLSSSTLSISDTTINTGITINLTSINPTNTKGSNNIVNGVTTDKYGRVTAVSYANAALTDTKYNIIFNKDNTATYNSNGTGIFLNLLEDSALKKALELATSGDATLTVNNSGKLTIGSTPYTNGTGISISNHVIKNTGVTAVTAGTIASNATGVYKVADFTYNGNKVSVYGKDTNTWRPVYSWKLEDLGKTGDTIDHLVGQGNTGVAGLAFSSAFAYKEKEINNIKYAEINLVWAEVDDNGNVTYV